MSKCQQPQKSKKWDMHVLKSCCPIGKDLKWRLMTERPRPAWGRLTERYGRPPRSTRERKASLQRLTQQQQLVVSLLLSPLSQLSAALLSTSWQTTRPKIVRSSVWPIEMYSRWFKGSFVHLPGVGCDNFCDLNADQFFLSHCHAGNSLSFVSIKTCPIVTKAASNQGILKIPCFQLGFFELRLVG